MVIHVKILQTYLHTVVIKVFYRRLCKLNLQFYSEQIRSQFFGILSFFLS